MSVMETNTSEPPIKCRKRRNAIETRGESLTWDKSGGDLFTVQVVAGMEARVNMTRAFAWNVGYLGFDAKGAIQVAAPQESEYRRKVQGRTGAYE
jgi:hypothetical protein